MKEHTPPYWHCSRNVVVQEVLVIYPFRVNNQFSSAIRHMSDVRSFYEFVLKRLDFQNEDLSTVILWVILSGITWTVLLVVMLCRSQDRAWWPGHLPFVWDGHLPQSVRDGHLPQTVCMDICQILSGIDIWLRKHRNTPFVIRPFLYQNC